MDADNKENILDYKLHSPASREMDTSGSDENKKTITASADVPVSTSFHQPVDLSTEKKEAAVITVGEDSRWVQDPTLLCGDDTENEVFFGDVTNKELKKTKKFGSRKTAVFVPGFRMDRHLMRYTMAPVLDGDNRGLLDNGLGEAEEDTAVPPEASSALTEQGGQDPDTGHTKPKLEESSRNDNCKPMEDLEVKKAEEMGPSQVQRVSVGPDKEHPDVDGVPPCSGTGQSELEEKLQQQRADLVVGDLPEPHTTDAVEDIQERLEKVALGSTNQHQLKSQEGDEPSSDCLVGACPHRSPSDEDSPNEESTPQGGPCVPSAGPAVAAEAKDDEAAISEGMASVDLNVAALNEAGVTEDDLDEGGLQNLIAEVINESLQDSDGNDEGPDCSLLLESDQPSIFTGSLPSSSLPLAATFAASSSSEEDSSDSDGDEEDEAEESTESEDERNETEGAAGEKTEDNAKVKESMSADSGDRVNHQGPGVDHPEGLSQEQETISCMLRAIDNRNAFYSLLSQIKAHEDQITTTGKPEAFEALLQASEKGQSAEKSTAGRSSSEDETRSTENTLGNKVAVSNEEDHCPAQSIAIGGGSQCEVSSKEDGPVQSDPEQETLGHSEKPSTDTVMANTLKIPKVAQVTVPQLLNRNNSNSNVEEDGSAGDGFCQREPCVLTGRRVDDILPVIPDASALTIDTIVARAADSDELGEALPELDVDDIIDLLTEEYLGEAVSAEAAARTSYMNSMNGTVNGSTIRNGGPLRLNLRDNTTVVASNNRLALGPGGSVHVTYPAIPEIPARIGATTHTVTSVRGPISSPGSTAGASGGAHPRRRYRSIYATLPTDDGVEIETQVVPECQADVLSASFQQLDLDDSASCVVPAGVLEASDCRLNDSLLTDTEIPLHCGGDDFSASPENAQQQQQQQHAWGQPHAGHRSARCSSPPSSLLFRKSNLRSSPVVDANFSEVQDNKPQATSCSFLLSGSVSQSEVVSKDQEEPLRSSTDGAPRRSSLTLLSPSVVFTETNFSPTLNVSFPRSSSPIELFEEQFITKRAPASTTSPVMMVSREKKRRQQTAERRPVSPPASQRNAVGRVKATTPTKCRTGRTPPKKIIGQPNVHKFHTSLGRSPAARSLFHKHCAHISPLARSKSTTSSTQRTTTPSGLTKSRTRSPTSGRKPTPAKQSAATRTPSRTKGRSGATASTSAKSAVKADVNTPARTPGQTSKQAASSARTGSASKNSSSVQARAKQAAPLRGPFKGPSPAARRFDGTPGRKTTPVAGGSHEKPRRALGQAAVRGGHPRSHQQWMDGGAAVNVRSRQRTVPGAHGRPQGTPQKSAAGQIHSPLHHSTAHFEPTSHTNGSGTEGATRNTEASGSTSSLESLEAELCQYEKCARETPLGQQARPGVYREGTPWFTMVNGIEDNLFSEPPPPFLLDELEHDQQESGSRESSPRLSMADILERKRKQMMTLRAEKRKIQDIISKQTSTPAVKAPRASNLVSYGVLPKQRFNSAQMLTLSDKELEAVTQLHTLCNSQRTVKVIHKGPALAMRQAPQSPHLPRRLSWHENLVDEVTDETPQKAIPSPEAAPEKKSILNKKDARFVYPYNDEPQSPVVVFRSRSTDRTRSSRSPRID